jgi:hypothetical protein
MGSERSDRSLRAVDRRFGAEGSAGSLDAAAAADALQKALVGRGLLGEDPGGEGSADDAPAAEGSLAKALAERAQRTALLGPRAPWRRPWRRGLSGRLSWGRGLLGEGPGGADTGRESYDKAAIICC